MIIDNYTYYIPEENNRPIILEVGESYSTLGILVSSILLSSGAFISQVINSYSKILIIKKKENKENP